MVKLGEILKLQEYSQLKHHGIKGMRWGVRRKKPTGSSYGHDSKISIDKEGNQIIKKGSSINRVSRGALSTNNFGGIYATTNKEDNTRYTKTLGPSFMGKLMKVDGDRILDLKLTRDIKVTSDSKTIDILSKTYATNKSVKKEVDESLFSNFIKSKDPSIRKKQIALATSALLGDANNQKVNRLIIKEFSKNKVDAIPDLYDKLTGTSKNPIIVLNHDTYKVSKETPISKEVYQSAKAYIKKIGKLPMDKVIE